MFKLNNKALIIFLKSIALLIVQAFLFLDLAFCPEANVLFSEIHDARISCLSPHLSVDISSFQRAYILYQAASAESLFFNRILSEQEVQDNGVEINSNTISITLGKKQFKVPPYLAGRVKRVHVTDFSAKGFTFQKLGIGLGRRNKTKAVILVDIDHPDNQIIFFEQGENIRLKKLASAILSEDIKPGRGSQFKALQRQDSILEKTQIGKVFLDTVLGIDNGSLQRARQVVSALKKLANDNSKLKSSLPVNLAFFSKDYILTFSRELRKHSFITVLKDRPQRGRFIAVVDELDPDNFVVFERQGNQVFVLGKSKKTLIPALTKQPKAKSYYFTDIQQGADFCRNISRGLVSYRVSDHNSSFSLRKGMQFHLGSDNRDIRILKVNQVTQATATGYQIKQRTPALDQLILESYPIYLLDPVYANKEALISDFPQSDLLFFDYSLLDSYPEYLSVVKNGNLLYLRKIQDNFLSPDGKCVVYAKIPAQDIISKITFAEQGVFTIKGINWENREPVKFRNVSQLSLPVIITQLAGSKHIKIDNALRDRFSIDQIIGTPYRVTLKFNKGFFEQGDTVFINSPDDWGKIQKTEDIKIKKFLTKNKDSLKSISSIFALIFAKLLLFPSISEAANSLSSFAPDYISTFISGAMLIAAISIFRYLKRIRDIGLEQKTLKFNPKRREFLKGASAKSLGVFLLLNTGVLAYSSLFKSIHTIKKQSELRPRMIVNLNNLAGFYENLPINIYSENKRLYLPDNIEYWQISLGLDEKDARIAAEIFSQAKAEIFSFYSIPVLNLEPLDSAQLIRYIARRISGERFIIRKRNHKGSHDLPVNEPLIEVDGRTKNQIVTGGGLASIIIGADPLSGSREVTQDVKQKNKPLVSRKGKVLKPKDPDNQRKEQVYVPKIKERTIQPHGNKLVDTVFISLKAKVLYNQQVLEQAI